MNRASSLRCVTRQDSSQRKQLSTRSKSLIECFESRSLPQFPFHGRSPRSITSYLILSHFRPLFPAFPRVWHHPKRARLVWGLRSTQPRPAVVMGKGVQGAQGVSEPKHAWLLFCIYSNHFPSRPNLTVHSLIIHPPESRMPWRNPRSRCMWT
jgi:hypothetical protein